MSLHLDPCTISPCYGCNAPIPATIGTAYCPACVAEQQKRQREELEAFDAFHAFADACARRSRRSCGE